MSDIADRIAKLLAKAESSTHKAERDAFNAKAEELMLRYGIEQAELESQGKAEVEEIVRERLQYKGDYAIVMGIFVNSIALALGSLKVLQSKWRNQNSVYVIGHKTDVEHCLALVNSLQVQAQTEVRRWWRSAPERNYLTPWEGYLERRGYLEGFASGAADRIRKERRDVRQTASKGAELVLVSKEQRVDAWFAEQYPKLGKATTHRSGHEGRLNGFRKGQQADVGTTRVGGSRTAIHR